MKTIKKILYIFFITLYFNTELFAYKEIVWFQHQRPPWMINTGEFKNQGYGDKIRQIFEQRLDEYKHYTLDINPSRFFKEIKNRQNVCYGPVMKLENAVDFFHWSKPLYLLPQHRIIVLEKTFIALGSPKEISMKELLSSKNYTFGKIANMNYFPIKLQNYEHQNNILSISTNDSTTALLAMMQKGRVDWIYDFPLYIKWHYQKMQSLYKTQFRTIKVKETKNNPKIIAYIACSKNERGLDIIQKINNSLDTKTILDIRKLVRSWQLDDATLHEFDRLNYEQFGF